MKKIKYNANQHGDFEQEWYLHSGCKEWWYSTSILFDEDGKLYSCQYTLMNFDLKLLNGNVAMAALTDYQNNRHYYLQTMPSFKDKIIIDQNQASIANIASARKEETGMRIQLKHKSFSIDLFAHYGHGPVWHCDNGKLYMGIQDEKQTTLYYSWTNMETEATLNLNGQILKLKGHTWFDKQGGPYNIADMRCHWEWFSLHFFDQNQAMLFTFPQNEVPEYDGTWINSDGSYNRFTNYSIQSLSQIEYNGLLWSHGWQLTLNNQKYMIEPLHEGYMNFAYFEELCYIKNQQDEVVGYCFAELLPGVLNQNRIKKNNGGKSSLSMKNLFKRVEF